MSRIWHGVFSVALGPKLTLMHGAAKIRFEPFTDIRPQRSETGPLRKHSKTFGHCWSFVSCCPPRSGAPKAARAKPRSLTPEGAVG